MGFLSKMFKKSSKTQEVPKKVIVPADTDSESKTSNSSGSNQKKRSKSSKHRSSGSKSSSKGQKESPPQEPKNIEIAKAFIAAWNDLKNADDMVAALYASPTTKVYFEDDFQLNALECSRGLERLYKSFPDMKFSYGSISVPRDNKNAVILDNVRCCGTHTGAPYSMVPGLFPDIEATGTYCINDEERFILKLDENGKVRSMEVVALGSVTGPAGFYEQIGGSMVPPS